MGEAQAVEPSRMLVRLYGHSVHSRDPCQHGMCQTPCSGCTGTACTAWIPASMGCVRPLCCGPLQAWDVPSPLAAVARASVWTPEKLHCWLQCRVDGVWSACSPHGFAGHASGPDGRWPMRRRCTALTGFGAGWCGEPPHVCAHLGCRRRTQAVEGRAESFCAWHTSCLGGAPDYSST